jgi:DNA polymerase kappa
LVGDTESKSYNKMHQFNYCVKKAGMEDVDEEKVNAIL